MFPEDDIDETLESLTASIENAESVLLCFKFDFDKKEYVIKDGSPELIQEYEATKQWIQKFLSTDIGTLEIYDGYKFGTSYKKMMGSKVSITDILNQKLNVKSARVFYYVRQ